MWYVIRTMVNPQGAYIKTTGYPYIQPAVMYCGESANEAIDVYNEVCDDIVKNRAECVYVHDNMKSFNSADAYFSAKHKGQPYYYNVTIYKE